MSATERLRALLADQNGVLYDEVTGRLTDFDATIRALLAVADAAKREVKWGNDDLIFLRPALDALEALP